MPNLDIEENRIKRKIYNFVDKSYSNMVTLIRTIFMDNDQKKLLKSNKILENKYNGRCFVLGNGPSIKNVNFEKLKNEIVFTVNQMPRLDKFALLATNFHVWSDFRFFQDDPIVIEVMKKTINGSNPIVFFPIYAFNFVKKNHLDKIMNIHWFTGNGGTLYYKYKKKFDYTKITPRFPTVIDYCITLAIYMGFKEIYLLGCDCTGFVNLASNKFEYSYEIDDKEKNRMKNIYSGKNVKMELKNYVKLFEDYEIIREYCDSKKIKIYNCSTNSLLYSIERKNFNEVI